ncbi:MAG: hypothetical protein LBT52_04265, partial [Clostridiales Family XIII bacterium]|nr:hypothetical protein [Clostridiales Family XIII bacterium]
FPHVSFSDVLLALATFGNAGALKAPAAFTRIGMHKLSIMITIIITAMPMFLFDLIFTNILLSSSNNADIVS